jgi:hypothetical protein
VSSQGVRESLSVLSLQTVVGRLGVFGLFVGWFGSFKLGASSLSQRKRKLKVIRVLKLRKKSWQKHFLRKNPR